MKLDDLQANIEMMKSYKEKSTLALNVRTIDIPQLKEKRGVFLIELCSKGQRARAIVRKGELRFVARQVWFFLCGVF